MNQRKSPQASLEACTRSDNRQLLIGVLLGISAAVFYTSSNTAFRQVSTQIDYVLAMSMKACLTLLFAVCIVPLTGRRGKSILPPARSLLLLIAAAMFAQVFGSVMMQRAFAIIGIALVVPIYIGSMVASSALLGAWFLDEKVELKTTIGLAVLLTSVFVLCLGGETANAALQTPDNLIMQGVSFVNGVVSATTVGFAYGVLAVTIRYVMTRHELSHFGPVVIVASVGSLLLGSWAFARGSLGTLWSLGPENTVWILVGGFCNGVAFSSLSASLRRLPAVYVNAINASQAAFATLVGIVWFNEPTSASLIVGLILMLLGFRMLARAKLRRNQSAKEASGQLPTKESSN